MLQQQRTTFHIVGGDSRSRAEQARVVFAVGHHAEIYAGVGELLERPRAEGVILAAEDPRTRGMELLATLSEGGVWLPVVLTSHSPDIEWVVAAVRCGALDYLELPLTIEGFAERLNTLLPEAQAYSARRRYQVAAAQRIDRLSPRERQVLTLITAGLANKEIAKQLAISPRTVEIHRANMMSKLGAHHPADAIKAWIAAGYEEVFADKKVHPARPRLRIVRETVPTEGELKFVRNKQR